MQGAAAIGDPNPGAAVQQGPAPAIGRIVLYRPTAAEREGRGDGEWWPAVITRVWGADIVNLYVLADAGPAFHAVSVVCDCHLAGLPRSWRWPARA